MYSWLAGLLLGTLLLGVLARTVALLQRSRRAIKNPYIGALHQLLFGAVAVASATGILYGIEMGVRVGHISAAVSESIGHYWVAPLIFAVSLVLLVRLNRMLGTQMLVQIDQTLGSISTLQRQAEQDSLTELYNHAIFFRELDQATPPFAVLMIDLDGFKPYNDRNGHLAGDQALVEVARLIRSACRTEDVAARYGGDEFAMLVQGITPDDARRLAQRISDAIRTSPLLQGAVTASVGIAFSPPDVGKDVVAAADQAMGLAKQAGRSCVCWITAEGPQYWRPASPRTAAASPFSPLPSQAVPGANLEHLVLHGCLEILAHALQSPAAWAVVPDADGQPQIRPGVGMVPLACVLEDIDPQVCCCLNPEGGVRTFVCPRAQETRVVIPATERGGLLAALNLIPGPDALAACDPSTLVQMGDAVGHLLTQVREAVRISEVQHAYTNALAQTARIIAGRLPQRDRLQQVLDVLQKATGAELAEVFMWNPGVAKLEMVLPGSNVDTPLRDKLHFEPREGAVGRVFAQQRPFVTHVLDQESSYLRRRVPAAGYHTLISIPMVWQETCLGVYGLYARTERLVSQSELDMLILAGKLMGAALAAPPVSSGR